VGAADVLILEGVKERCDDVEHPQEVIEDEEILHRVTMLPKELFKEDNLTKRQ
jgi:hypothetical protein